MRSHQRIIIMSYFDEKFLQLYEDLDDSEIEQFKHKSTNVSAPFTENSEDQ